MSVGVACTLAYAVLFLLLRAPLGADGANALALALTAVGNTAANRRFTFGLRGRAGLLRQHALGAIVYVLTLGLTTGALAVLHGVDASPPRGVELAVLSWRAPPRPSPASSRCAPGCSRAARRSQATPSFPSTMGGDEPAHRILAVDDEPSILEVLSMALRFHGFEVQTAATGEQALTAAAAFKPQLMVLDMMLPDMEGFEVARRLGAQRAEIPIIFLTARDATQDKIRGLTIGADDYVTKPFSLEELVARIRTVLRRTGQAAPDTSRLAFEDVELDDDTREVARAGAPIELTATEYRLLRYLMLNPRRVLTREQILNQVWDYDFGGDARVLETYVSYLRKKLDAHGPPLIHTVRGVGYALRAPRA